MGKPVCISLDDFFRAVSAAAVDNDIFQFGVRLLQNILNGLLHRGFAVVRHGDYGYFGVSFINSALKYFVI